MTIPPLPPPLASSSRARWVLLSCPSFDLYHTTVGRRHDAEWDGITGLSLTVYQLQKVRKYLERIL